MLLAAFSACIVKGIECVVAMLDFSLNGMGVCTVSQDAPSRIASIEYEMITDSNKANYRLELLHENIHKYGTVYNSVGPGTA